MKNLLLTINNYFASVPDRLRPWRWWILCLVLVLTVLMTVGISRFTLDVTFDSWFSDNDPVLKALDDFRQQFGSDDSLFLVYEAKDGDVFSAHSLQLIDELTQNLEQWDQISAADLQRLGLDEVKISALSHIKRVQSLTNVRVELHEEDTLRSQRLIPQPTNISAAEIAASRALALQQRNLPLFLFSRDYRFGALMITTDFGAIPDPSEDNELSLSDDHLDTALDNFTGELDRSATIKTVNFADMDSALYISFIEAVSVFYNQPHIQQQFTFHPVGNAAIAQHAWDSLMFDALLVLAMLLVINLLLWTLFHSASAIIWPQVAIVLSVVFVLGGLGWLSIATSTLIVLTVMLIIAIGIADCVHVMSSYLYFRHQDESHEQALSHAYGKTGLPILLTSITTMAGMAAITVTGMPQFVIFGCSSAVGVGLALIYTIYLLPILLDFWHPMTTISEVPKFGQFRWLLRLGGRLLSLLRWMVFPIVWVAQRCGLAWLINALWLQPLLDRIPAWVQRHRFSVLAAFMAVFGVCMYGVTQVRIDSNLIELYPKDAPVRVAYSIVDQHMMGSGNMEIMLDMGRSDALMNPDVLQVMANLQQLIETNYSDYVIRTYSLADLVKDTHAVIQDGQDHYRTIPANALAVSQLLYLFNSANPNQRRTLVSDDYSRSHIAIQLRNASSSEYTEFINLIQSDVDNAFASLRVSYPNMTVQITGTFAMMMRLADDLSRNQFKSLALAIVIISGLMVLTLGSLQAGLIAIIPNLIPATLAFGLMGLLGIALDTDTLLIAPLIMGIAVDDTIHFMTHYRMALTQTHNMGVALVNTIKEVGQAVAFTSFVLGCGFLMLSFSNYLGLVKIGVFGSLAIFIALLCDLLFFPALIMVFKPRFGQNGVVENLDFTGIRNGPNSTYLKH